jgi:aromatase
MPATHQAEHEVTVAAPATAIYGLIADVGNWPRMFPPTVYADYVERSETDERIRIWATANGDVKNWTSRRRLDPAALRVEFRQEVSSPPVAAMGGTWIVEPLPGERARVRLLHDYSAVGDDPAGLAWIEQAVDHNSTSELAALKASAEILVGAENELLASFEDSVRITGSAKDVYDFINEADRWQERLPHVSRVSLREDTPGLQLLEMETKTADGSSHTTTSVRVCFPHARIIYKQIAVPALMSLHTGYWLFAQDGPTVTATSQHTVIINTANITAVLGEGAGIAEARSFVRDALGANSRATLGYAKQYAEARS